MFSVKSVDVVFQFASVPVSYEANHTVTCTPQEAFAILTMPCFSGLVLSITPNYEFVPDELSEVSKE